MRLHLGPTVLALCAILSACASPVASPSVISESRTAPSGPSRIVVNIKGNPPTLSGAIDSAGSGGTDGLSELELVISSGLGVVTGDGRLVPRLAEAMPTVENGLWKLLPDGRMETTWKIRPNARWHDGTPFTANDLTFTASIAADRQIPIFRDAAYDSIEGWAAPDASTFVVTWHRPYITADSMFTMTGDSRILPMPRHLLEQHLTDDKTAFVQLPYWSTDFVSTGPYKLRDWFLGSHVVMSAFDQFVQGRPKIDEVEARFILDPSAIVANVLAGTIDVTMGRGLALEQAMEAREQSAGKVKVDAALLGWTALFPQFLSPNPALVGEITFRRALLHALDRQELSDSLQAGMSPIAHSILYPTHPDYPDVEKRIVTYDYDARKAVQMLESLGLSRAGDGGFRDATGQRIALEVRTTRDDLRERLIHPVGDYWRQIGIGSEPVIIATQAANDRQYRASFPAFELTRQPMELRRYHGSGVPTQENGFRGSNRVRYANPEFDAMLDRYFTTIPRQPRMQALGDVIFHMTDQLLTMGVFYTVEPSLINSRLVNVAGRKIEDGRLPWNIHEWELH